MQTLEFKLLHAIKKSSLRTIGNFKELNHKEFLNKISTLLSRPEKHIAILSENSPDCFLTFISCILSGKVLIPINPLSTIEEITSLCQKASVELIVFDNNYKHKIPSNFRSIKSKDLFASSSSILVNTSNVESSIFIDDTPLILFSSGTTGDTKPVLIKKNGLEFLLSNMKKELNIRSSDKLLIVTHLSFFQTLWMCLLLFIEGGTIVFKSKINYENYWEEINEENATISVLVPTIINKLSFYIPETMTLKLNNLRFILCGGESINTNYVHKLFQAIDHLEIVNAYGMVETTGVCTILTKDTRKRMGSVGKPINQVTLKIENKDINGIGKIQVKTPAIMKGYYPLRNNINNDNNHEWFDTGDLGFLDEEGYLYITGREKLTINKGGVKINPFIIENILSTHPYIKDSLVTKTKDDIYGETLVAKIIIDSPINKSEIFIFLEDKIPKYYMPSIIEFVEVFSLTSSDKKKR